MAAKEERREKKESILDFGKWLEQSVTVKFIGGRQVVGILKGFDPLVKHLTAERGFKVRRVSEQKDAFDEIAGTTRKTPFERLIWLLKKEKVLPGKRKGLEGKVKSWFSDISAEERGALMERLFEDGFVKESEKKELTFFRARLGAAPLRWTVSRLLSLILSPSILHPRRSLPPQAAEDLG